MQQGFFDLLTMEKIPTPLPVTHQKYERLTGKQGQIQQTLQSGHRSNVKNHQDVQVQSRQVTVNKNEKVKKRLIQNQIIDAKYMQTTKNVYDTDGS